LLLAGQVSAGGNILEISGKPYSTDEIRTVMKENGLELPDQAVQKLKRDAVLGSLRKSESELYLNAFGVKLEMDEARAKARDLPILSKKAAVRKYMFQTWLDEKARSVPVRYLNMEKYWAMVQETAAYKIRAEAGQKISSDHIAYTFAELFVPAGQVLATRAGRAYLKGSEFNAYVKKNYNELHAFVKRGQILNEARNYLIGRIAGEKIATEKLPSDALQLNGLEVERHVRKFVQAHMLDDPLSLTEKEYLSPSDMMQDLYLGYMQKHAAKLNRLRSALNNLGNLKGPPAGIRMYLHQARLRALKSTISRQLDEDAVYEWMRQKRFPATLRDAYFVLTNQQYEQHLSEMLEQNGIVLHLLDN
jgi:hypothetical protein